MSGATNLPASVSARLLHRARQTGDDYQGLLTSYCLERFLYRVGVSQARDRFVLKGAMLLRLWSDRPYRATRDLDLLGMRDASSEIPAALRAICEADAAPDAVIFDAADIELTEIRAEDEYAGVRATLPARLGTARLRLQIDIGRADAVWPEPNRRAYPTLLDFPAPEILVYPREAVIAEKLEAMVVLGDRNSRIKDFFDLDHLAASFEFDRSILAEAVRRTFARRGTPIPTEAPIGLTPAYWENPSRPAQVRAFARRAGIEATDRSGATLQTRLASFLLPVLADAHSGERRPWAWPPGGPWVRSGPAEAR
ncbi:MAG: nucleotidyl transferase AbiEii/AbiGii toxin family protein [Trueperaceae bacterium]|nr:nucleotidyl transferase AbiEii/AbiGii toxin family protein [Trueperaceae bacterium]